MTMAGVYVHLPFCKSRCIYCGFYSTTSTEKTGEYVDAVCRELRYSDWPHKDVGTIYFGGGTPSQLTVGQLGRIKDTICSIYNVSSDAEITTEANPDDITEEYVKGLKEAGFNRLSMGVQTFDDERLAFLHRRHTSAQAFKAVEIAKYSGFDNISIDLMFGFPGQTLDAWRRDVDKALSLGVQHISAYSLMYEEGTLLDRMLEEGSVSEIDEDMSLAMYEYLIDALQNAGFEHYEISNWALPGRRSCHNSSYWRGIPYLGVGAAAHSFDGKRRWSNPDSLTGYLNGIDEGNLKREYESLDECQMYDEFVMTGLRTSEGVDLAYLERLFGKKMLDYCLENSRNHITEGRLVSDNGILRLTRKGLFVSNDVMSDLMMV